MKLHQVKLISLFFLLSLYIVSCGNKESKKESVKETLKTIPSEQRLIRYLDAEGKGRFLLSSGKLKLIMERLYQSAYDGKVNCFADDSLKKQYTLEEVKKRGGKYASIDVDGKDVDTFQYYNFKDMAAYFVSEIYEYHTQAKWGKVTPKTIGLAYSIQIPGMDEKVYGALFYIKTEDLAKVLSKEEVDFLLEFSFRTLSIPSNLDNLEI